MDSGFPSSVHPFVFLGSVTFNSSSQCSGLRTVCGVLGHFVSGFVLNSLGCDLALTPTRTSAFLLVEHGEPRLRALISAAVLRVLVRES